jgi:hypothetical protein
MEGTTVLTPVWSDTAKTLTITPIGTGNTNVAINTSAAGAAKITFAAVSVMVDRTAPVVTIGDPAPMPVKIGVSELVYSLQ